MPATLRTADRGPASRQGDSRAGSRAPARRHLGVLVALGTVLLCVVALYEPARQCYQAWRDNGVLRAQNEQAEAENNELQQDYDRLLTLDGVEEEARKRGYVSEGETSVTVEGLPDDGSQEDADPQDAPEPWYVSLGDLVFGYQVTSGL